MSCGAFLSAESAAVVIDGMTLLEPTSFAVPGGELWSVTGPNGSGKTTLLRAFVGSRSLTSGSCRVMGEEANPRVAAQRRIIASLVDAIPIARDMTIREQVGLVAASWEGNSLEAARRVDLIIDRLGLTSFRERFPHQETSGQVQLFNLALVLVRPASVVLLDEPERHLDEHRVGVVVDLLEERASDGVAILAASHETLIVRASAGVVKLT